MDDRCSRETEVIIDFGSGVNARREESSRVGINSEKHTSRELNKIWSGYANASIDGSITDGEAISFSGGVPISTTVSVADGDLQGNGKFGDLENAIVSDKKTGSEKPKKKNCKKPPRPPRPPKPPSLDAAKEKLVREFTDLAVSKRARVERMKALKKMKSAKSSSSTSSIWALVITVIFCFVMFWQGFSSRSGSNLSFVGSPISPVGSSGGLISVQFYKNTSGGVTSYTSSASPTYVR